MTEIIDIIEPAIPGSRGPQGPAGEIVDATATALPTGADPTVTLGGTPSERTIEFGLPRGPKGDPGSGNVDSVNGKFGPDVVLTVEDVGGSVSATPGKMPVRETGGVLPGIGDPTAALHAANKRYVDNLGITSAAQFGVAGNGTTNDSPALQAAINATPDGGELYIPAGSYLINSGLTSTKSIHVNARGARFIQNTTEPVFTFTGAFGAASTVASLVEATEAVGSMTVPVWRASVASFDAKVGDIVKVVSNSPMLETSNSVTPAPSDDFRAGMFAIVVAVASGSVSLVGYMADPMTTGLRIAKMQEREFSLTGGVFESRAAGPAKMFSTTSAKRAVFRDVVVESAMGQVFSFASCWGYLVDNCVVQNAKDGEGSYGYGIDDNASVNGVVRSSTFSNCRHAYTTTSSRIAANTADVTLYGRTMFAVISDCVAYGTTSAAFDTHSNGRFIEFVGCKSISSPIGFQLRGQYNAVRSCEVVSADIGIRLASDAQAGESYGHTISDVTINGTATAAIVAVTRHGGTHPNVGTRDNRESTLSNIVSTGTNGRFITQLNTTLFASDLSHDFAGDSDRVMLRTERSLLRCDRLESSGLANGTGTSLVLAWVTQSESMLEINSWKLSGFSPMSQRLAKVIATDGTPVLRVAGLLMDYLPSTGAIYDRTDATSWVEWSVASSPSLSSRLATVSTPNNRQTLIDAVGRTREDVTLVTTQASATILEQLPWGRAGQLLTVINLGTGALTVNHSGTGRTIMAAGANLPIPTGRSMLLAFDPNPSGSIWPSGGWRQVASV